MNYILDICEPLPSARFAVFRSFQYTNGMEFYEVLDLEIIKHPQTILAYEMNGEPLSIPHGAPLRLRWRPNLDIKW